MKKVLKVCFGVVPFLYCEDVFVFICMRVIMQKKVTVGGNNLRMMLL